MIISHQLRCIFLKTRKTGGTSLEIALSKFCGPDDVIAPIVPEDEAIRAKLGFRGAQNYDKPARERTLKDRLNYLRWPKSLRVYYNHMPAPEVRAAIGDRIWNDYLKITLVRNPWDMFISFFYWEGAHRTYGEDRFADFVAEHANLPAWVRSVYSIDGQPVADYFVRHEALAEDLGELSAKLGLPEDLGTLMAGIRAKGGTRDKRRSATEFFPAGAPVTELVRLLGSPEVERFGFKAPSERLR